MFQCLPTLSTKRRVLRDGDRDTLSLGCRVLGGGRGHLPTVKSLSSSSTCSLFTSFRPPPSLPSPLYRSTQSPTSTSHPVLRSPVHPHSLLSLSYLLIFLHFLIYHLAALSFHSSVFILLSSSFSFFSFYPSNFIHMFLLSPFLADLIPVPICHPYIMLCFTSSRICTGSICLLRSPPSQPLHSLFFNISRQLPGLIFPHIHSSSSNSLVYFSSP